MTEKAIFLEKIDSLEFYGANNSRFNLITRHFPKLKIIGRGNKIKVFGKPKEILEFEEKIKLIITYLEQNNSITKETISMLLGDEGENVIKENDNKNDIIVYGNNGKAIKARTKNQKKLVVEHKKKDLLFAIGPAGTGKTYIAIAIAISMLRNKEVKRIILSRPVVEAGEHLGFLPGDLKEKLDPYLQPLYDALRDMISSKKLGDYFKEGIIEIAPLAFMRGRTLKNAFVILDEAQNASSGQLKMFLTRMGVYSKFIVTGDLTQIDLTDKKQSGLLHAIKILEGLKNISVIRFDEQDIMRHDLVKKIVNAYSKEK